AVWLLNEEGEEVKTLVGAELTPPRILPLERQRSILDELLKAGKGETIRLGLVTGWLYFMDSGEINQNTGVYKAIDREGRTVDPELIKSEAQNDDFVEIGTVDDPDIINRDSAKAILHRLEEVEAKNIIDGLKPDVEDVLKRLRYLPDNVVIAWNNTQVSARQIGNNSVWSLKLGEDVVAKVNRKSGEVDWVDTSVNKRPVDVVESLLALLEPGEAINGGDKSEDQINFPRVVADTVDFVRWR